MSSTAATFIIRGRLGSDPELRYTQNGQAVVNFSLAVEQGFGDNKRTEWVRVSVWGERQAESANTYLSKGDLVSVQSDTFRVSAWASNDGNLRGQLEITARRVDYIITKREVTDAPTEEEPVDELPM